MTEFEIVLDRLLTVQGELAREREARIAATDKLHDLGRQPAAPSRDDVERMLRALAEGKKIDAIRYCRALTGHSLKESKDLIEAACSPKRDSIGDILRGATG